MLVGNKCDLESERQVTKDEAAALATKWGSSFMEASARQLVNVQEAFLDVARQIDAAGPDSVRFFLGIRYHPCI